MSPLRLLLPRSSAVLVVLGLPLLVPVLHLSDLQYGTLAGLTVYAVPQVLAATVPVSLFSAHIGTLVKLVRVLMLGPVILVLSVVDTRCGARKRPGWGIPEIRQSKRMGLSGTRYCRGSLSAFWH